MRLVSSSYPFEYRDPSVIRLHAFAHLAIISNTLYLSLQAYLNAWFSQNCKDGTHALQQIVPNEYMAAYYTGLWWRQYRRSLTEALNTHRSIGNRRIRECPIGKVPVEGHKLNAGSEHQVQWLAGWVSEDPNIRLKLLHMRLQVECNESIWCTTISNHEDRQLQAVKKLPRYRESKNFALNTKARKWVVSSQNRWQNCGPPFRLTNLISICTEHKITMALKSAKIPAFFQ